MSLRSTLILDCDKCGLAEIVGNVNESARSLRYRAKGEHGWVRRIGPNRSPQDVCDRCRRGLTPERTTR